MPSSLLIGRNLGAISARKSQCPIPWTEEEEEDRVWDAMNEGEQQKTPATDVRLAHRARVSSEFNHEEWPLDLGQTPPSFLEVNDSLDIFLHPRRISNAPSPLICEPHRHH